MSLILAQLAELSWSLCCLCVWW